MALTVNRTSRRYVPSETSEEVVPVQVGTVTNLVPSLTPAGRGVLSWLDRVANELRLAVLDDREAMFENDSVEVGDVRTIYAGGARTIVAGSTAVIDGALYAFVSSYLANNGLVECYVADDVENPTSWSLRGTIQTHTTPGGFAAGVAPGGPPTILPSGRWVLPHHSWVTFGGSALETGNGIHTSDNAGLSWTTRVSHRKGALFGGSSGPGSTSVAADPSTGRLEYGAHIGPVGEWNHYNAGADGETWVTSGGAVASADPCYYFDNETDLFAFRRGASETLRLYRVVSDVGNPALWEDLGIVAITGATGDDVDGLFAVPLWLFGQLWTMAFTSRERITRQRIGGMLVGAVAL